MNKLTRKIGLTLLLSTALLVPQDTQAKSLSSTTNSNKDYQVCQTVRVGPDRQVRDIYYMYSVRGGSYWLEPTSKTENVIWVDDKSLKSWGLDKSKLHHGNIGRGTFDRSGWELLRIR